MLLLCFLVILESINAAQAAYLEQARYFNGTFDFNAYNATTLATVTGAMLFIALNTAFVTLFLNPSSAKSSSKKANSEDLEYNYDAYYDYDTVRKR